MNMETRNGGSPVPQAQEVNAEAPSGFILKLFQMVNGAPDEVISVSRRLPPAVRCEGVLCWRSNMHQLFARQKLSKQYTISTFTPPSALRSPNANDLVIIGPFSVGEFYIDSTHN